MINTDTFRLKTLRQFYFKILTVFFSRFSLKYNNSICNIIRSNEFVSINKKANQNLIGTILLFKILKKLFLENLFLVLFAT